MARRRETTQSTKSAILYLRYSNRPTVNADEAGNPESLIAQLEKCKAFAEKHGLTILAVRKDEKKTGRNANRAGLTQAIAECRRCGAILLLSKLDRLSRSVAYISALMESGIEFLAVDSPYANRLTVHILAAVAEDEARRVSERTSEAMISMQKRGRMVGGVPPFGWKQGRAFQVQRGKIEVTRYMLEVDEEEQGVLARVRELAAGGALCDYQIAKTVRDEGLTARNEKPICPVKVRRWIQRDIDAGGKFDPTAVTSPTTPTTSSS